MRLPIATSVLCVSICIIGCSARQTIPASEEIQALFESPQTRPEFVSIWPMAGARLSLSSGEGWGDLFQLPEGDTPTPEAVCVGIVVRPLLRPGDDFDSFGNVSLSLNDSAVESIPVHTTTGVLAGGNDGGTGPSSERLCWYLEKQFGIGLNRLDLSIWTSTNETFGYSWVVEVAE